MAVPRVRIPSKLDKAGPRAGSAGGDAQKEQGFQKMSRVQICYSVDTSIHLLPV